MAECGQVASRSGSYVTCTIGHSRCDGTAWGACIGNRIVARAYPVWASDSAAFIPCRRAARARIPATRTHAPR